MTSRPKPLAGVRVLDLTRLLPGPLCTLHLADLGADVVKVEDPQQGDYARSFNAAPGETSSFFTLLNRNKRALRLDLKHPRGREAFLRLARGADVVVESFRPGVMERLGVGYPQLAAANPKLVYCAITGFGQDGPYRDLAGHDVNYLGYAGVLDQIGPAGGAPVIPNLQIADMLGGALMGATGILAALLDARTSGRGRLVDASMTDAVLAHAVFPMLALLSRGRTVPRGEDTISGALPCYNVYPTADGRYVAVGALERKFWDRLCEALSRPDLKLKQMPDDPEERARVKAELTAIFASRPFAHWVERFRHVDCCVSPVLTLEEALADPHFNARGMIVRDVGGRPVQFACPLHLTDFAFSVERPAPQPGEHSEEVLAEAGFTGTEIEGLRDAGVI
ncbi:MAG: CoA transferase [Burkholderiales bacterium]|nr:MAG: CoA transferase [Burkholderiales bacterium]